MRNAQQIVIAASSSPKLQDILGEIDFREVAATQEQKLCVVNSVIDHFESVAFIARKYHFSRAHLHRMVRNKRRGKAIESKHGRPRLLDEESLSAIDDKIQNVACTSVGLLKQSIISELEATIGRRYRTQNDEDMPKPKMSRRTLKRYGTFFIQECFRHLYLKRRTCHNLFEVV